MHRSHQACLEALRKCYGTGCHSALIAITASGCGRNELAIRSALQFIQGQSTATIVWLYTQQSMAELIMKTFDQIVQEQPEANTQLTMHFATYQLARHWQAELTGGDYLIVDAQSPDHFLVPLRLLNDLRPKFTLVVCDAPGGNAPPELIAYFGQPIAFLPEKNVWR